MNVPCNLVKCPSTGTYRIYSPCTAHPVVIKSIGLCDGDDAQAIIKANKLGFRVFEKPSGPKTHKKSNETAAS